MIADPWREKLHAYIGGIIREICCIHGQPIAVEQGAAIYRKPGRASSEEDIRRRVRGVAAIERGGV